MNKLILFLIVIATIVVGVVGWRLYSTGRVNTGEMMQLLNSTVDDGGTGDLQQLEQEAAGL